MTLEEKLVAQGYQQEAFKAYLIANASESLTEKILASDKNIADAELFIAGEILKENKYVKNGSVGISNADDSFIFGQLVHYFEEGSIAKADINSLKGVRVSTSPKNETAISNEKAIEEAKKKIEAEYKAELRKAAEEEKKAKEQAKADALAKKQAEQEAKKKAIEESEHQTSLFDFL